LFGGRFTRLPRKFVHRPPLSLSPRWVHPLLSPSRGALLFFTTCFGTTLFPSPRQPPPLIADIALGRTSFPLCFGSGLQDGGWMGFCLFLAGRQVNCPHGCSLSPLRMMVPPPIPASRVIVAFLAAAVPTGYGRNTTPPRGTLSPRLRRSATLRHALSSPTRARPLGSFSQLGFQDNFHFSCPSWHPCPY